MSTTPDSPTPARILIADDHAILRSGLRLLIENPRAWAAVSPTPIPLTVVAEAADGEEALRLAAELKPDLILLDLNMPGMGGLEALPKLKTMLPDTRTIILTMHDETSYLQGALNAGASGYVLKRAADNELLMAIQAVLRGETYIHSAMTQKLLQSVMPDSGASQPASTQEMLKNPWNDLSEREHDVLRLVALGYTNSEIAETVFLSVKTVETYRARGMEKLDLQTRAQLVNSALKYGLLDAGKT